jgi:alpha-L-rhamnosidase
MFGGGIVWFYRKIAGMNADPDYPGYKNIIFRPQPADGINNASYSNLTPYGTASIDWKKEQDRFEMEIEVPVGSTATVYVPSPEASLVRESGKKIRKSKGIEFRGMEDGYSVYKIRSGNYRFSVE